MRHSSIHYELPEMPPKVNSQATRSGSCERVSVPHADRSVDTFVLLKLQVLRFVGLMFDKKGILSFHHKHSRLNVPWRIVQVVNLQL